MKLNNLRSELGLMAVPLTVTVHASEETTGTSYLIGGIIAVLILGYLIYSLIKPDKF
jgi:K+-transporting ATPase KdpF subunit